MKHHSNIQARNLVGAELGPMLHPIIITDEDTITVIIHENVEWHPIIINGFTHYAPVFLDHYPALPSLPHYLLPSLPSLP